MRFLDNVEFKGNVLTKNGNNIESELENLDERIDNDVGIISTNLTNLDSKLTTKINSDVGALDSKLTSSINTEVSGLNTKITNLDNKLTSNVSTLTTKINTDVGTVSTSLNTKLNRASAVNVADTSYGTAMARAIYAGTTDLTAGTSTLTSGTIYVMYE